MFRRNAVISGILLAMMVASACSVQVGRDNFGDRNNAGDAGPGIESGNDGGLGQGYNGARKTLKGIAMAPNGTLPLPGVLVYWTRTAPEPIPNGVYCDTCVELGQEYFAISKNDGSVELNVPLDEKFFLVTQKGQFRRVREITVDEGTTALPTDALTLPGRQRPNDGDTIPKIAVLEQPSDDHDGRDRIQFALRGLGIDEWEQISGSGVVGDIDRLSQYQFLMVPCSNNNDSGPDSNGQATLREFVKRGGKMYVSDYAAKYIDRTFSDFFQASISNSTSIKREPSGRYEDQGLRDWLSEVEWASFQPDQVTFEGVYSNLNGLNTAMVPSPDGSEELEVAPKVWTRTTAEGSQEGSISFPYGCGRSMFSVFHVHGGDGDELLHQEKALLYMLLEVNACVKPGGEVN